MAFDETLSDPHLGPSPEDVAPITTTAPKTRRDVALDGLRGIAVLLVFLFHYGGGLQSSIPSVRLIGFITSASWTGVVLFFALSGFLITGSLWESNRHRHRLRNFYMHRALRVLPLYFLALIASATAAYLAGDTLRQLRPLSAFVFFLQDFPHLGSYALETPHALPLYHFWSLAVEEQFYLFWPLILLFAHSRRHALRLSIWYLGLTEIFLLSVYTLQAFLGARRAHLYDHFLLTQSAAIAMGCAVSLAMGDRLSPTGRKPGSHRIIRKYAMPAFFIGLGIYILTSISTGTFTLTYPLQFCLGLPAISLAAAASIPLVLRTGLPRRIVSSAPLAWIGRISYGFYVYHILLQPWFDHLSTQISHTTSGNDYQITRALIAFVLTCGVSWLSFYLFETPILSLKRFFPVNSTLPWGEPITETETRPHRKRSHSHH